MTRTIVVDDEPAALNRYASYVEEFGEGFSVAASCRSSKEAFEAALRLSPELIITDIRMPGEDGLSLLGRLRDSGWKGKAVVVSGFDDFGYAQQAIRLGVFDFLLKPVFPEDMRKLLESVAESRGGSGDYRDRFSSLAAAGAAPRGKDLPEHLEKVIRFFESRCDSRFSMEEAARAACVSKAYLSESFKKALGLSPMEYVRALRIARARELLAGTNAPLKEIADSLAFPDLPTFAKLFRKIVGTSPGAYRKGVRAAALNGFVGGQGTESKGRQADGGRPAGGSL